MDHQWSSKPDKPWATFWWSKITGWGDSNKSKFGSIHIWETFARFQQHPYSKHFKPLHANFFTLYWLLHHVPPIIYISRQFWPLKEIWFFFVLFFNLWIKSSVFGTLLPKTVQVINCLGELVYLRQLFITVCVFLVYNSLTVLMALKMTLFTRCFLHFLFRT